LFCIRVEGLPVALVSARTILNDVVKALEGSMPSYSFRSVDGLYEATGFVVVLLRDEIDDFTLLEATGDAAPTKDGAEEAAAKALISAAKHEFGVVVSDFSFREAEALRKENEILRKNNLMLRSGWSQSVDHLEMLQKTLESITVDVLGGCSRISIGQLAHEAAVWAEENVWGATAAVQEMACESIDDLAAVSLHCL